MANILSGPPLFNKWKYNSIAEFLYEKMSLHASSTALVMLISLKDFFSFNH